MGNLATGLRVYLANRHTYVYDPTAVDDDTVGRGRWKEVGLMPEAFHFVDYAPGFRGASAVPLPTALRSYSAGTVDHTLTLLADGRVLKLGGRHNQPGFFYGTDRADIFEPRTGTWTAGASLPPMSAVEADGGFGGRIYHSAAPLGHGLVLVTGGNGAQITFLPPTAGTPATFQYLHRVTRRTGLIYDSAADTWTRTPDLDMLSARAGHELVRQHDSGAIVAIGGRYISDQAVTQPLTEVLDLSQQLWTPLAIEPAITVIIPGIGPVLTTKQADFPVRFGAMLDDGRFLSVAGADPNNTAVRLALAKVLIPGGPREDGALPQVLMD